MKKTILSLLLLVCVSFSGFSQDYQTGIGFRGGLYNGLTIKHFVSSNTAFETLITSRWRGIEFTELYEIHHQIGNLNGLNLFYGVGAHIGFYNGDHTNWGTPGDRYTAFGVDGILGLEYSFRELPLNISVDWKPEYNIAGYEGIWYDGGAFSIRYIF
jgi:hypothetical protein